MSNGNRQLMIAEKAYCLRVVYFDCERSALNQPPIQTIRFRSPDSGALNQSSLNIQRIFRMHLIQSILAIRPANTAKFISSILRIGWALGTMGAHCAGQQMGVISLKCK